MRHAEIAIMGDLNFTEPERDYVERVARDRHGVAGRVGFYAAVLTPMLLFAVYGLLTQDSVAELLAFLGVFLFVLWRASQELGFLKVAQSALRKVADHERRVD
jgi:hypothetical protein